MTQPTVYIVIGSSAITKGDSYQNHPGEILETVEWNDDGTPNWTDAGICDTRGAGVEAFYALVASLHFAEANARELGLDIERVPSL